MEEWTAERDGAVTSQLATITRTTPVQALPELLTPEEFRTVAGLGRATTYDLIRSGQIPSVRFGRAIRIPKSALLPRAERA